MSELLREAEARRSRRERGQSRRRSRARYLQDRIGDEAVEGVCKASRGCPEPIPVVGQGCYAVDGEIMPMIRGGAGFASYDQVISALSTGKGQPLYPAKNSITVSSGKPASLWGAGGIPPAGAWGTNVTGRAMTDADTGAIPYNNPTAPATMHLLTAGFGSTVALGTLVLYDRLVEYPFTPSVTTLQTFSAPTIPSRDHNGAALGAGIMMFVENDITGANTAATAPTLTLIYTNSAGTGSRSSAAAVEAFAMIPGRVISTAALNFWWPLVAGDSGVRSVQSAQLSATLTTTKGTVVLARPLSIVPVLTANSYVERDLVLQLASLPRIYDDSAMGFLLVANTTTSPFQGRLQLAQN